MNTDELLNKKRQNVYLGRTAVAKNHDKEEMKQLRWMKKNMPSSLSADDKKKLGMNEARTGGLTNAHIKRLAQISKKISNLKEKGWNKDNHPDIDILHQEVDDIMKKKTIKEEGIPTNSMGTSAQGTGHIAIFDPLIKFKINQERKKRITSMFKKTLSKKI